MSSSKIVQLFSGETTTANGDTLASLRELSDEDLESRHDYIQYMFPSEEASQFNSVAPTVTPDVIEEFKQRDDLRNELVLNFQRILTFWDFSMTEHKDGKVTVWLKPEFNAKPADDVIFRNTSKFHNFLRLTRVIKSLHVLGCTKHAVAFRDFACETLVSTIKVPLTTVKFWKTSIEDSSSASPTAQAASESVSSPNPSSTRTVKDPNPEIINNFVGKAENLMKANNFPEEDLPRISEAQESARVSGGRESNRVSDGRESNRKPEARESDRISEAQESNRISDARESNRLSEAEARESERISEAPESNRISDARESNVISEARESNRISDARESNVISEARESNVISEARESNRISDAQVSNTTAVERLTEPIPVSSVESIPDQMRASDTSLPVKPASVKGRRGSLIPQADIIDPEHGNTQDVARAQAEEAVIAAKLAEAERNFAEKAEKLEAERLAKEERARKQQEEIERVRAKQRAKEEEEQKKKEQSLTSKFMKLGEKATGWTMGEQKNRPLDEKPPIVFKGVNDFSPIKGYSEQMERERQEELRRRKAESEQCFGCMSALM